MNKRDEELFGNILLESTLGQGIPIHVSLPLY